LLVVFGRFFEILREENTLFIDLSQEGSCSSIIVISLFMIDFETETGILFPIDSIDILVGLD
jgi:hypothetical protein